MHIPSTNGPNGRDAQGRFGHGNKEGKGNPLAGQVAKLRAAVISAVTEGDIHEILKSMVRNAKNGDVSAAKIVLQYAVGVPADLRLEVKVSEASPVLIYLPDNGRE